MPTGQFVCTRAIKTLGMVEQGGQPSVSESLDALDELNSLWSAYSIDEDKIYEIVPQRFPLQAGLGTYRMGPSTYGGALADFNAPIPSRVYQAFFLNVTGGAIALYVPGSGGIGYAANDTGTVSGASGALATYIVNTVGSQGEVLTFSIVDPGTGYLPGNGFLTARGGGQPGAGIGFEVNINNVTNPGQNRKELKVVGATQYLSHGDLSAIALTPDEIYPDMNPDENGFIRINMWPVLSTDPSALEMVTSVPFNLWALTANYNIPAGLADDLNWTLAFRLLSSYGTAVDKDVAAVVTQAALKADARFKSASDYNRGKGPVGSPGTPATPAQAQ